MIVVGNGSIVVKTQPGAKSGARDMMKLEEELNDRIAKDILKKRGLLIRVRLVDFTSEEDPPDAT